jgi:hypothetical protein
MRYLITEAIDYEFFKVVSFWGYEVMEKLRDLLILSEMEVEEWAKFLSNFLVSIMSDFRDSFGHNEGWVCP